MVIFETFLKVKIYCSASKTHFRLSQEAEIFRKYSSKLEEQSLKISALQLKPFKSYDKKNQLVQNSAPPCTETNRFQFWRKKTSSETFFFARLTFCDTPKKHFFENLFFFETFDKKNRIEYRIRIRFLSQNEPFAHDKSPIHKKAQHEPIAHGTRPK